MIKVNRAFSNKVIATKYSPSLRVHLASGMKWLGLVTLVSLLSQQGLRAASVPKKADDIPFEVHSKMDVLLDVYCYACHDEDKQKGDIRLDQLASLSQDARLDLLNKMQEQIFFEEMPPKKKKSQPTPTERKQMTAWISSELKKHAASKLEDKIRMPSYGNYVDHDRLFSGEYKDLKAFTPDRRWLISEFIFDAKFNKLLNHKPTQTIDGKRQSVIGDNNRRVNLTNPFLLPTNTGVRYYDTTTLNGGHLLTMITNAKNAATHMMYMAKRDRRYLPGVDGIMAKENGHNATLAAREAFLNKFIGKICSDIYKGGNTTLLPKFVRVETNGTASTTGKKTKKAPFHAAQPGNSELELIYRSMRRHQKKGESDAQLIAKCEKEWFHFGDNERKIQARVTFLQGYMPEWRAQIEQHNYDKKHKPHTYSPLKEDEMILVKKAISKHRKKGDRYNEIISKCIEDWSQGFVQERIDAGPATGELVTELVDQVFTKLFERAATAEESEKYALLTKSYIKELGNEKGMKKLIQTLMLSSEFVYRAEFGQGVADKDGRKMLSPRDVSYAIAYALTDSSPDKELADAAKNGKLNTREDYKREVTRLLKNRNQFYVIDEAVQRLQDTASITNQPIRKLRFFREFFGYQKMLPIFKDNKRFGGNYDNSKGRLVGEADRLVDHILENDQNVIETLLDTEKFYVYHSGNNEAMTESTKRLRKIYDYFKDKDWKNFEMEDLLKHKDFLDEVKLHSVDLSGPEHKKRDRTKVFKQHMTSFALRFDKGQKSAAPYAAYSSHGVHNAATRTGKKFRAEEVTKFFNISLDDWDYPAVQPAKVAHRKGMLTHPAWLIAHSQNTETDPVIRGKWIREKLLAGTVPDVPITVDAVIPENHHKTLRGRLVDVTEKEACWKCHERMNPLGYAFESYDDFGRFRTQESLEHPDNLIKKGPDKAAAHVDLRDIYKTLPVNPKGHLSGTGDKNLDGDVQDALDLVARLAKSERVRQSVIRYAFRYFMGRNEVLSDSKTLIDADQAYIKSGGSFDAVIVSFLTSDSFLYRKAQ
jgi:hypothetical protein